MSNEDDDVVVLDDGDTFPPLSTSGYVQLGHGHSSSLSLLNASVRSSCSSGPLRLDLGLDLAFRGYLGCLERDFEDAGGE